MDACACMHKHFVTSVTLFFQGFSKPEHDFLHFSFCEKKYIFSHIPGHWVWGHFGHRKHYLYFEGHISNRNNSGIYLSGTSPPPWTVLVSATEVIIPSFACGQAKLPIFCLAILFRQTDMNIQSYRQSLKVSQSHRQTHTLICVMYAANFINPV